MIADPENKQKGSDCLQKEKTNDGNPTESTKAVERPGIS